VGVHGDVSAKMTMLGCPANPPQTSVMKNYRHAPPSSGLLRHHAPRFSRQDCSDSLYSQLC
ncbi:MAG: hypothetical protein LBL69_05550, partial [Zoogloeaceae bacterium]|nr:hypothetical protein [Zoogloeaceae bacterium]